MIETKTEEQQTFIHSVTALLLFFTAIGFAVAAHLTSVPYLHFFAGWFCRSALVKVRSGSRV